MSLTPKDRIALSAGRDMWSTAELAHAGVPSVNMADGPMGVASGRVDERDVSVLTPSGVSLGATFDPELVARVGAVVGGEAKRRGVDLMLAPNLNLHRTPLAGRAFELYGEDPLLAGVTGAAWTRGLQSRHVGAVAKHLVCNDTETGRDRYDAVVDEATLREVYLLPFEMAVQAGCAGVLTAYNKLNGRYCAESRHVVREILKGEWGFAGFTVSDWFGTHDTVRSAEAGLDLEMPGPARIYGEKLEAALAAGQVDAALREDAAERVAAAARAWAGGDAGADPEAPAKVLTEAAAASFTLLRNDGDLLPLVPGAHRRIAVIGPNALAPCFQGGTFAKIAVRPDAVAPIDAIRARYGADAEIVFAPGADPSPRLPSMAAAPARDLGDDATRGMTVDYFDGHDFSTAPIASETRDTNSLTWFVGMHEVGVFDRPAGVRASGWFTPTVDGVHRVHIGGTADLRLRLDGVEHLDLAQDVAPSDLMGVLKGGDSQSIEIAFTAGKPVFVEVELRFAPRRAHGLWWGIRAPGDADSLLAQAEAVARQADAVILVVGETADSGVESKDRPDTLLPADQVRLAQRICAANPNVAVIANVAHAFDAAFAKAAKAFMVVWYPGEEFGPALAQVLAGDREPSGRLPVTFAAAEADYPVLHATPGADDRIVYAEGTRVGYRHFLDNGLAPAFAFGSGLGYGDFAYEHAAVAARPDGGLTVEVTVRNAASRAASEVVQVYSTGPRAALLGFAKTEIPAGEARRIAVEIEPIALRRWTDDGWAPDMPARIVIGRSAVDQRLALETPTT